MFQPIEMKFKNTMSFNTLLFSVGIEIQALYIVLTDEWNNYSYICHTKLLKNMGCLCQFFWVFKLNYHILIKINRFYSDAYKKSFLWIL